MMRSHRLAKLIPPMTADEYAELRENIRQHGLREPITIFEDRILDGRHRARACRDLGITPAYVQYEGDEPAAFVWSMNGARRNLSSSQLAIVGARMLGPLRKEKERQRENRRDPKTGRLGPSGPSGPNGDLQAIPTGERATEAAAALFGSSPRAIRRAQRVVEADPKLADQVAAGEITVTRADKLIRGTATPVWPEPGSVKDPGPRVECPTCGHMVKPGDIRAWNPDEEGTA